MGNAIGGIMRGATGEPGIAGVKDSIGGVAGSITSDRGGMGVLLQGLMGNLNSTLTQVEQLGQAGPALGSVGQTLLKSFQTDLTRLAYVAALEKAVKKAKGTGPFYVETAINDLWVALDGVRKGQQVTSAEVQKSSDLIQSITTILKQMHDSSASAIQNMR